MATRRPPRLNIPDDDPEVVDLATRRTERDLRVEPDLDHDERFAHNLRVAADWYAWKRAKDAAAGTPTDAG